jgi:hypothetical protein
LTLAAISVEPARAHNAKQEAVRDVILMVVAVMEDCDDGTTQEEVILLYFEAHDIEIV